MPVCIKSSYNWEKTLQTTFKNMMIFQSYHSLPHTNRLLSSISKVDFIIPTIMKMWHWDPGSLRWFHSKMFPRLRQVIWIVGERGNEGKTFLQNYISNYYGSRRVVATDIAGRKKNIAHYLTKLPLECKDIFVFNHPASAPEAVAYDLLEDIKDGRKW